MLSKKKKVYLRINIVSLLFTAVSLISVTLAWFAYSGLASTRTEVDVKAWYIEFEKNEQSVSNNIVISLEDIYPGMEPKTEEINIKNLGDTEAKLKYQISRARILNDSKDYYELGDNIDSNYIEDVISHNYPFHIDISIDKPYIDSKDQAVFKVNVTWPLDSGDDTLDSLWGRKAYQYDQMQDKLETGEKAPSIEVAINVTAEQAIDDAKSIDEKYLLGTKVYYNPVDDIVCVAARGNCIETYIIDTFNKIEDTTVALLPSSDLGEGTFQQYQSLNPNWTTNYRLLNSSDILKILSLDIENSNIKIAGISDKIIGKVIDDTRANNITNNIVNNNGYVTYSSFSFIKSQKCIWTDTAYNELGFALDKTRLYGENQNTECRMIPVLVVPKNKLAVE